MTEKPIKEKPIIWMGSSRKDLRRMPDPVKLNLGHALNEAQHGDKPLAAKPLSGFGGAAVLEIRDDDESGTYRAVYTVKFSERIYVLHCFQKKSKKGIKTPQSEIELIRKRLREAQEHHAILEGRDKDE